MSDISWADGLRILQMARESLGRPPTANPQPPPKPAPGVLTDAQAHALQLMWMITGQDGSTVGKGSIGGPHQPMEVPNEQDRQDGGPAGPGNAPALGELGSPDPGTDSHPEAPGPVSGVNGVSAG